MIGLTSCLRLVPCLLIRSGLVAWSPHAVCVCVCVCASYECRFVFKRRLASKQWFGSDWPDEVFGELCPVASVLRIGRTGVLVVGSLVSPHKVCGVVYIRVCAYMHAPVRILRQGSLCL